MGDQSVPSAPRQEGCWSSTRPSSVGGLVRWLNSLLEAGLVEPETPVAETWRWAPGADVGWGFDVQDRVLVLIATGAAPSHPAPAREHLELLDLFGQWLAERIPVGQETKGTKERACPSPKPRP